LKKISLRKLLALLIIIALMPCGTALASEYYLAGRWLAEGGGFAKKSLLRVRLEANGAFDIKSAVENGTERVTGYGVYCELNASRLGINTWSFRTEYELPSPIEVVDFNPTMNDPFRLPPFTIDNLTYTVTLTDANSGTVGISGYVDIDTVGQTEINADCAIWRQGTPKPDIPDTSRGCGIGTGALALLAGGAIFLGRRSGK
jgi:hypothetical protein